MDSIFAAGVLERIAESDSLLAFDFDGTLAPIVDDPARPAMRPSTRHLLAQAAQSYPCAVISGRPEEDLLHLLDGVTVWYVIGNRALLPPDEIEKLSRQVRVWLQTLTTRLAPFTEVSIEDKGVSLALHFRCAAEHDRAHTAIVDAATRLENARIIEGKEVVNLLPAGGPNKSSALVRLCAQLRCGTTLYVGDDRTDEDVFALGGELVGVRVGAPVEESAARYWLRDQAEVDELLERLIDLRGRRKRRSADSRRPARKREE